MQLEPYHPGKLVHARRHASALTVGVTALGALAVGVLALGSALARRTRPTAHEIDELALRRVDAIEPPALRYVDESGVPVMRRLSVRMVMTEEWISRAGE